MARPKPEDALRAQKEARQKKLLIALAPVLLALVAWQGPGTVKAFTGGSAPPPPEVATPAEPAEGEAPEGVDPAADPPPTTAAPGTQDVPAATPAVLPNTTAPPEPGPGQLVAFDRFVGKDPFRQQVVPKQEEPAPPSSPPKAEPDPTAPFQPSPGGNGGSQAPPTYAVVTVNGVEEALVRRATFPSSEPIFRLTKITRKSIKIGLVSGEFTQGQKTVTVAVGKSTTLLSQPDGQRYVIKLVAVG